MWGMEPAESATIALQRFQERGVGEVLVPGFGYGRNAKLFLDHGMAVTGIEISQTAIAIAREELGLTIPIHHGSAAEMPFDEKQYDGIFCYALLHLLDEQERRQLIDGCYRQLKPGGLFLLTTLSKNDSMFGKGREVADNRYETNGGALLYYYEKEQLQKEFAIYPSVEIVEIEEPNRRNPAAPPTRMWLVTAEKPNE